MIGDDIQLGRVDISGFTADERQSKRHQQDLDGLLKKQAEEEAQKHGRTPRFRIFVAERKRVEDDEEAARY